MKAFDLVKQYHEIRGEIDAAVLHVLESGAYILGEEVKLLESELAKFIGTKYSVGVASGTDALFIALKALDIKEGDEVITTPFTFIATAEVIMRAGAKIVFVDIDESYNIDLDKLEDAITDKTKAIIPVHLYGNPVDMDRLMSIAKKYNLYVIEDCAQAIGALYKNRAVGSFGVMGAFSFYPTKNLGAYGDGGLITVSDRDLYEKIKAIRAHGSYKKYYHEFFGLNSRLDTIQAAILLVKLKYLNYFNSKRRYLAEIYTKKLKDYVKTPMETKDSVAVYHQYTIATPYRDELRQYLKERGIPTVVYYPLSLHLQKVFSYLGYKQGDFPVSERMQKEVLSLPMYPELEKEEALEVADTIIDFFNK